MLFLLVFVTSAVAVAGCNEVELVRWRRQAGAHWAERARFYFPALNARATNLFLVPLGVCFLVWGLFPKSDSGWHLVAAFLGSFLGNYPFDRALVPGLSFRVWFREACGMLALHAHGLLLFGLTVRFMPDRPGWRMAAVVSAYLLVHLALQFGVIRFLRLLHVLRPAPARVQELVAATSANLGVPVRGVWEMAHLNANAFAVTVSGDVAFTSRMLAAFTDDEIRVIAAHELGHLSESRGTRLARLAGSLVFLPLIFLGPAGAHGGLKGVLLVAALAMLILVLRMRLSRTMETRADRVARETETETAAYARALEHLHQLNQLPAVLHQRTARTHPDLYDRMIASGLTPDYPRPPPPARSWTGIPVYIALFIIFLFFAVATAPPPSQSRPAPQQPGAPSRPAP